MAQQLMDHHHADQAQLEHQSDDGLLPRRQYIGGRTDQVRQRSTQWVDGPHLAVRGLSQFRLHDGDIGLQLTGALGCHLGGGHVRQIGCGGSLVQFPLAAIWTALVALSNFIARGGVDSTFGCFDCLLVGRSDLAKFGRSLLEAQQFPPVVGTGVRHALPLRQDGVRTADDAAERVGKGHDQGGCSDAADQARPYSAR
jgi:hypothetical protein